MHKHIFSLFLLPFLIQVAAAAQVKPITVTKSLIEKIAQIQPDESNAHTIEMQIGEPAACMPLNAMPSNLWMCQWKGVLTSHRIENTLNITFESGMIANVIGVDAKGKYFTGEHGGTVKESK